MASTVTKLKRDPTLRPQPFPRPRKGLSLIPLRSPSPPQRGPATLRASPPDPQEGGGREPLPTGNSHFFAARFRNTPGLMPSRELCNQGHRSRAKQTRLCVQPRPRGSTPGQGGARARPRVSRVCSAKEPRAAKVPSRAPGGLGPAARARPLPHRGRPRLRAVNLVPSPAGRRHRPLPGGPRAWGEGGRKCRTPVPAPFQLGTPLSLSPTLNPRSWGSRELWCGKVMTPPPNSGGDRRRWTRASSTTP